MAEIKSIRARKILDSRGKKTVEVKLKTEKGMFSASAPSGTSKGKYEAVELPAKSAVKNINRIIGPTLKGKALTDQKYIDNFLIKLDGTKNKKKLGANAIVAVSVAILRALAKEKKLPLWKYTSKLSGIKPKLPKPAVLLIEGGMHGKTKLDIQEFMVIPEGRSFGEQFLAGKKIYERLKKILKSKFGNRGAATGFEGAFTPPLSDPRKVLDLIMSSAKGYNVRIGLDCAASSLKRGNYDAAFYQELVNDYPILFLEDPFGEEDWQNWRKLLNKLGGCLQVGDDLTVTNPTRIKMAYKKRACNAVIIKPNQIGTVSEATEAVMLAKNYGWKVIVSHRSDETKDDFIADFATGIGADFIKAGAPSQKERMAKYNRLLEIEREFSKASSVRLPRLTRSRLRR